MTTSNYSINVLNGSNLGSVKADAARGDDKAIKEAARQFESMFLKIMLKSMRATTEGDPLLGDSDAEKQYRDLHDSQLSMELSSGRGIGIAAMIERQIRQTQQNIVDPANPEKPVATDSTAEKRALKINHYFGRARSSQVSESTALPYETSKTDALALKASNTLAGASSCDDGTFACPQDFIQKVWPYAEKAAAMIGVDPKALVAQAALETGWGKHMITCEDGSSSNNLFGIKADQRWSGDKASVTTTEYFGDKPQRLVADFRSYESFEHSFNDYVNFLRSNPRYAETLEKASEAKEYINGLQQAGYATDPAYAEKIFRIMDSHNMNNAISSVKKL